jgi:Family of unknown function (DUF6281)
MRTTRPRPTITFSILLASALWVVLGCQSTPTETAADCSLQIRYAGTVYSEAGFSPEAGPEIGDVEIADCEDVGDAPRGAFFPEVPRTAKAQQVDGFDSGEVIGIDEGDFVRVYLSDQVSAEREATLRSKIDGLSP